MQRLSPQDASSHHLESAVSHGRIASVAIDEGPPSAHDAPARMARGDRRPPARVP